MTKGGHPCLQNVGSHYPLLEYGRRNGVGLSTLGHTKVPVGAFPEDNGSIPAIIQQLTTICNSSTRDLMVSVGPRHTSGMVYKYTCS